MGGTAHHRMVVTCGHCGVVSTVRVKNTNKEEHLIVQRLRQVGWLIGKKDGQHRCPGCYSAIKIANKNKSHQEKSMPSITSVQTAAPTVTMSRDDRRIIFQKLNEIYADDKTGYSGDWTDARVASDLGVARAWVTAVRDEMFGPEGGNANIRQSVEEAKAVLAECRKLAEAAFSPLLRRAEKIEKTMIEIEKSLR